MIYVHIPFCRSFCTYCDFYSEIATSCLSSGFAGALVKEIEARKDEISAHGLSGVNTLYIGGGTPSVLPLSVYASVLDALEQAGAGRHFDEFTVEVNPEDIVEKGHAYVEGLLELGVNRISMGVQSFDDRVLKWMNRRHDSERACRAYSILEEAGVGNISIDLIFGLPGLSSDGWKKSVGQALEISSRGILPKHISSYQLSVEPGSALATMASKGLWTEASEEECAEQYNQLCEALSAAGYHHYEISNFAQPGFEARHNSAYWRHIPYIGLGPGAHSFTAPSLRRWNTQDLRAYIEASRTGDFLSVSEEEHLTEEQLSIEKLMLGLRTSEGLPEDTLKRLCPQENLLKAFSRADIIKLPSGMCRIPEDRFFVSDSIISSLL